MDNEIEYQEMPDPVQNDLESCIPHLSEQDCLSILEDVLDLEETLA